jgi:hypothetical protein
MPPTPPVLTPAQEKTLQVLRFLREYEAIRLEPIRNYRHHDFTVQWKDVPFGDGCSSDIADLSREEPEDVGGTVQDLALLRVSKQVSVPPPSPPESLFPWFTTLGTDPEHPPVPAKVRVDHPADRPVRPEEEFAYVPGRPALFTKWLDTTWTPWAMAERQRRKVQRVYERLFGVYLEVRRESEQLELVCGNGLLAWRIGGEDLCYPLVTARVELVFDRTKGVLTLHPTTAVPELSSEIFHGLALTTADEYGRFEQEYRGLPIAPWDLAHIRPVLEQALNSLGTAGSVVTDPLPPTSDRPMILADPMVMLRRRRSGYARDIDVWQALLRAGAAPPVSVAHIVGAYDVADPAAEATEGPNGPQTEDRPIRPAPVSGDWSTLGTSLLFPLAANEEQRDIAQRLAHHSGVVVQGPPGTGKSHTIANLISHLLAHGRTVLVTAQTDRALQVLRKKIPEGIRNLCISVLGSDADAQNQLQESVRTIVANISAGREVHDQALGRAVQELTALRGQLAEQWQHLTAAQRAEAERVTIGGRTWTPSYIGEHLRARAADDGWLPDAIPAETPCPLSPGELAEFFGLLGRLPLGDLEAAQRPLPVLAHLPAVAEFATRLPRRQSLAVHLESLPAWLQRWAPPPGSDLERLPEILRGLHQDVSRAVEDLTAFRAPWLQAIRRQISADPQRLAAWWDFATALEARRGEIFALRKTTAHRDLRIAVPGPLPDVTAAVTALRTYVGSGGSFGVSFGLLHKRLKQTREACHVDGRLPGTTDDCDALLTYLKIRTLQFQLGRLVANELVPLGAPAVVAADSEDQIHALLGPLQKLLSWREKAWNPLRERLSGIGCRVQTALQTRSGDVPPSEIVVEETPGEELAAAEAALQVLDAALARLELAALDRWRQTIARHLADGAQTVGAPAVWRALATAWHAEDAGRWGTALEEVARLWGLRESACRCASLHVRLAIVAPQWAGQVYTTAGDPARAVVPPGLDAAWLWSQLRSWLMAHLRREAPDTIRQRIATLQQAERDLIDRQVTHATWSAQIQRAGREEQAALVGWQQTIARLGKGRGRRSGELKREAQRLMNECRSAVPVWIMPLGRVIENFAPTGQRFGVVITDESSQMDAFGLLALLRAERAVVVGDNMQISPAAVGVNLDAVQDLMRRLLDGIPAKHLYDGQQSLYDLARRAFGGTIRLREHFRCMPEIIGFSNQFYNHEIQPLRDPGASRLTPPVVMHRVAGYREPGTNINLQEAKEVAALIAACCQHPA